MDKDLIIKNIKYLMKVTGETQESFCKTIKCNHDSLKQFFYSDRDFSKEFLERVCETYFLNEEELKEVDFKETNLLESRIRFYKMTILDFVKIPNFKKFLNSLFFFNHVDNDDEYNQIINNFYDEFNNEPDPDMITFTDDLCDYYKDEPNETKAANFVRATLFAWASYNSVNNIMGTNIDFINDKDNVIRKAKFFEEYHSTFMNALNYLMKFEDYRDYVYFILSLRYLLNFFEPSSNEKKDKEMRRFGVKLLMDFYEIGNIYAIDLVEKCDGM